MNKTKFVRVGLASILILPLPIYKFLTCGISILFLVAAFFTVIAYALIWDMRLYPARRDNHHSYHIEDYHYHAEELIKENEQSGQINIILGLVVISLTLFGFVSPSVPERTITAHVVRHQYRRGIVWPPGSETLKETQIEHFKLP